MTVYIVLLVFIGYAYLLRGQFIIRKSNYLTNDKLHKRILLDLLLIGIFCFFLLAFRDISVGIDTAEYERMFLWRISINDWDLSHLFNSTEWGYTLLQKLLKLFGFNFRFVIIVEAVIYIASVTYLIYRYSSNPYLSFFFFITFDYFLFGMSGIRQTIAIALTIVAFEKAYQRKPIEFVLLVLVATTFHMTAIAFLPVYILKRFKIKFKHIILVIVASFLIVLLKSQIQAFLNSNARISYAEIDTGGNRMYLFILSMLLVDIFFARKDIYKTGEMDIFTYLIIATVAMFPILQFSPVVLRLHYYYSIYFIVYLPNVFSRIESKHFRYVGYTVYTLVALFYMFQYAFNDFGAVPYHIAW